MPKIAKQAGGAPKKGVVKKATGTIADRILPMQFDDYIKILIYGRSGTGKTTVAGTFPGKILWLICSGGNDPGELRSLNTAANRGRIEQLVIEDSDTLRQVLEYQKENRVYDAVALDHVSGLQNLILKEVLGLDEIPATKSWGLARQQDYGTCNTQTIEYLRAFLSLPECNRIILGQERERESTDNSEIVTPYVGVALQPGTANWLYPACDYIVQTFIRNKMESKTTKINGKESTVTVRGKGVEYCARTGPHDVFTTKFRVADGSKLPDVIVDPNYNKLLKLIRGE